MEPTDHLAAHELFRIVSLGDSRHDLPLFESDIDHQAKQFVGTLDLLGLDHSGHTKIDFGEIIDGNRGRERYSVRDRSRR